MRYLCTACGKSHSSTRRKKKLVDVLWNTYVHDKHTRSQIARDYRLSTKTVERLLDAHREPEKMHHLRPCVVVMDATYFGRRRGILVARDPNEHENLHVHEIVSETKAEYQKARTCLEEHGYTLQAVVLDGKRGIPAVFSDIPVQICQFHQWEIVKRKLTTRPRRDSHKVLLSIAGKIAHVSEHELRDMLAFFARTFADDLNEKTDVIGLTRPRYTHQKLRSAYGSMVRNLPYLYTYEKHPELCIPNTTNSLDGSFNVLKMYVNVHRGLRPNKRFKIIKSLLRC